MKKLANVIALVLAIIVTGCPMAGGIVAAIGPFACGALAPILGPSGEWWGTACEGLVKAIATEIAADTAAHPNQAKQPCDRLVPVPEKSPAAWVCPGYEEPTKRALGAAVTPSALPMAPAVLPTKRASK